MRCPVSQLNSTRLLHSPSPRMYNQRQSIHSRNYTIVYRARSFQQYLPVKTPSCNQHEPNLNGECRS